MAPSAEVHLCEPVACLALATDLGMGQPLEHALRTCRLAVRVGEALGLEADSLADAYYIALLRFAGCNAHADQDAVVTGDEITFRAGIAPVLNAGRPKMLRAAVGNAGAGLPPAARARMVAGMLAAGPHSAREPIAATCEVAQMIAARLGMGPGVVSGLAYTFEHYDGSGYPRGASGEEIPVSAHLVMVARDFELLYRMGGRELVREEARKRRGRAYDPRVADGFLAHAWELLEEGSSLGGWDAVLGLDPRPQVLTPAQLRSALECFGDFSDVRSRFTHGYSHRVCELVAAAAGRPGDGLDPLPAAALVQELGMTAVPSAVVGKAGPLTDGDWERVRLHPYFSERLLARCPGLAPIGALAGAHHERMDGKGYPRGSAGPQLSGSARLLGAAGAFVAMTSERPWRSAMSRPTAASALRESVESGALDAAAVEAVLAAAGEPAASRRRAASPGGLTEREVEVLRLISRGFSNRRVAERLVISVKTVGRHIENIYAKAGVSTRAGATMFALQNGLTEPADS